MHSRAIAASHLIPVISCKFELGGDRQFDLGERDKIVEACLAGSFLLEEPAQLIAVRAFGEPGKERIALTGSVFLQLLEPCHKAIGVGRRMSGLLADLGAQFLDEGAFEPQHSCVAFEAVLPICGGKLRGQAFVIPMCKTALKAVCLKLRSGRS